MTDGLPPIEPSPVEVAPRRSARTLLIAVALSFVLGLVAMAFAARAYLRWSQGAVPVVVVPQSGVPAAPVRAVTDAPATIDALTLQEAKLTAQLGEIEARLANVDVSADAAFGNATRAEGLLVAFAARRALDRGLRLGYVEGQLRARFGEVAPQEVAAVIEASRDPLTLEELRLGLDGIAPQLMSGALDQGWWQAFRRELGSLIILRQEATPSTSPANRLGRARRLLDGGRVEGALAEVAHMPGAPRADTWMHAARRYVDARRALDVIEAVAITGQPAAPPGSAPARPVAPLAPVTPADVPGLGASPPAQ